MLKRLLCIAALAVATALPGAALAQSDWPNKPIRWVIPFPAGGQAEIASRIVAEKMAASLGQPILIEAKPGANGNLGSEEVARSAPDGYTWLGTGVPLTTAPAMNPGTLNYDPLNDLTGVIRFGTTSFVLVVPPDVPADTLEAFIAWGKEQGDRISYAGSGIGSLVHLGTEMFKLETGLTMQLIPYTGQPPAIADLLAGRVQFMALGLAFAQPLLEAKQLKALAILDAQRHPNIPDVPSIAELGYPQLVMGGWAGLHVPAGTPRAIIDRINAETAKAVQDPAVIEQMTRAGWGLVAPQSPEAFAEFLANEAANWQQTVTEANISLN